MKRHLIAVLALVFLAACGGTRPEERKNEAQLIDLRTESRPATVASGWINLRTLQIHDRQEIPEEDDVYIEGLVTGWVFLPQGEVQGPMKSPSDEADPKACWLRLRDRTIHLKNDGGMMPSEACLSGLYDSENELFYPDSRTVLAAPKPAVMPTQG